MTDLPQHAAQVALFRNLHDPAFQFAGLFRTNWFTPYLIGYMSVDVLTPLLGIVTACKVVVAVALMGVPIATAFLMDETGADPYWALLTIPAMYSFTYTWGLLNFIVATPVGLLFLIYVMRHARKPTLRSSICLGLLAALLFFCHALICLFFLVIACLYMLSEIADLRRAILALSPLAAALPIMLLWYSRTKSSAGFQDFAWGLGWIHSDDPWTLGGRVTGFFPRLLGVRPSAMCLIFGAALFVLPFLAGAKPIKRVSVWVPLAVCVYVLLFAPREAFGAWAVSHRFTMFALPFFVIGLEQPKALRPAWRGALLVLLIGWIAFTTSRAIRYDAVARDFDHVLSSMEPNQRALSLVFVPDSELYSSPVFLHFPAWYSATKEGVVDMNFALWPTELVLYRPADTPPVKIGFEWNPQTFTWSHWGADAYRYFVVRAPFEAGRELFRLAPCRVSLVAHSGDWWLYEKAPSCSPSLNP
jgi:hypothetical protein